MINTIFKVLILVTVLIVVSCETENTMHTDVENEMTGLDTVRFLEDLERIETKTNIDAFTTGKMPENKDLQLAITLFTDYAIHFPNDIKSADYLLKASDFSHHLGQNAKSVVLLDKIITNYSKFSRLDDVMYNRAHYLDFELRDTVLAKQYYLEFIQKYPNSEFVLSAQARLDQNFMTAEELIELWTKN